MPNPVQFDPAVVPARKHEVVNWVQAELQADTGPGNVVDPACITNAASIHVHDWPDEPAPMGDSAELLIFLPIFPGGARLSITKRESVPIVIQARIAESEFDLAHQFLDSCLGRVHSALVGKTPVITNGRCVLPLDQQGAVGPAVREMDGTRWTARLLLRTAVAPS